jgi:hypothetical protein
MSPINDGAKGHATEESLREYFIDAGYFVVRGVPVVFEAEEVSDVDLWLYIRTSALHRSRSNVDVKARQRAKAFERVLWARGLQAILALDDAIVATTDKRPAVKRFALQHGVKVLDGKFLQRLQSRTSNGRLTEEEFFYEIDTENLDKVRGQWRGRLDAAKAKLVTGLDFSGCNFWLNEACFFLSKFAISERRSAALRAFYLMVAFFHLGLDFRYREFAFEQDEDRRRILLRGFQQGEKDWTEFRELLRTAAPELSRELENLKQTGRESMLAQYFAETRVSSRLFDVAKRFETLAFARALPWPETIDAELKSVVGVLADYAAVDRRKVIRGA